MTNVLEVKDIHTYIGQFYILEGISFEVPVGSITVLLGRNGAGKTTTLKSIMGLTPPRDGHILLENDEIQGWHTYQIAGKGIGYVPENRAIFRDLTVEENLKIAEREKGDLEHRGDFIFSLFRQLSKHTTVLLVEQNFIMASQLADRYVIIESGKSVQRGKMTDLVQDQETIRRYLGVT
jgi:branched-chain amino acid transport system ATP-binding protein